MKKIVSILALFVLITAFGTTVRAQRDELSTTVDIQDENGQSVGTMTLTQEGDGVRLVGEFQNLPPGPRGIHIHAVGACTPDFAAAGPHFNPEGRQHGLDNPEGAHAGDMPNLVIADDGTGTYDHLNPMVTLREGPNSLFDEDGTSIVIHADEDDQVTDPTGNSGARIACGVIPAVHTGPAGAAPQQEAAPAAQQEAAPAALPETGYTLPQFILVVAALIALVTGLLLVRRVYTQV